MSVGTLQRQTGAMALTDQERSLMHEALDRLLDSGVGGSTWDPNVAASFMEIAARKHILLTPTLGAFRMRPGWELAFTKLKVDTSREAKLVYAVNSDDDEGGGGRAWGDSTQLAFHKPLLYMIRTHLGVEQTGITRIEPFDDLCFLFNVKGEYLGVDGQVHKLEDMGGLDLREGSAATKKILAEARGKDAAERQRRGEATLMRKRAKVMQFATTNAEERLIVSYGFRSSYTKKELDEKYIICVRPIYTGFHPDPEIQRILLLDSLKSGEHASALLFGDKMASAMASLPPQVGSATPQQTTTQTEPLVHIQLPDGQELCPANPRNEKYVETDKIDKVTCPTCQELICTPKRCLGIKGRFHIEACYGNTEPETKARQEDDAWTIPDGPAKGLKINDPKVTPQTLIKMRNDYAEALNTEGSLYAMMSDEAKDFAAGALRTVQAEISRRGIKEEAKY